MKNAKAKSIKISNFIGVDDLIYADEDMLSAIIRNLISNAIKYTANNGEITIKLANSDNYIQISVIDNGIGITKENLQKIFKIDSQISTLGTNNEKGTGLGLILCKEFIEKHNGKIWMESELGKGSAFHFTLPIQ